MTLFESPVPKTEHVGRTVLSRILCNPDEDFATPILDIETNPHITTLVSGGICVCFRCSPRSCTLATISLPSLSVRVAMIISNCTSCFVLKQPFAGNAALLDDGNKRVDPPCIPDDVELVRFNPLFAHLFAALSKSQSMSRIAIVPSENHTVMRLTEFTFPAIKATNDLRTPLVSKHTVGYIHALMIDTITNLPTEIIRTRALRNKKMVIEEPEENEDVYRTELRDCLVDYYEKILKMDGAGGIPGSSTFKQKFKRGFAAAAPSRDAAAPNEEGNANGDEGDSHALDATAEDAENADAAPTPPPAAAEPAAAAEEVDGGKKRGGRVGKARGRGAGTD
jgi:hypothetical protein